MAKTILVQCRICKEKFNRLDPNLKLGEYFLQPSRNYYYHKKCYDEYQTLKMNVHANMNEDLWFDAAWDLLKKELKYDFNFVKVEKQWNSYLKNKMTAKGIYFSLKYFYEIRHGDVTKSENGIGIVPHVYAESCEYWAERETRDSGICAAIEQQIKQAAAQKIIEKKMIKTKAKKRNISLSDIEVEDFND